MLTEVEWSEGIPLRVPLYTLAPYVNAYGGDCKGLPLCPENVK